MNTPNISLNFTVNDIHKIREYHYEFTKNMSTKDRTAFYKEGADEIQKEIEAKKTSKIKNNYNQTVT